MVSEAHVSICYYTPASVITDLQAPRPRAYSWLSAGKSVIT